MAIGTPTSLGFQAGAGITNTVVLTTSAASAAGNSIIVPCHIGSATTTITGVTDSAGNTYTQDVELLPSSNQHIYIWSCHNAAALASGATITVTASASNTSQKTVHALSVSGLATTSTKDRTSTNEATSTTWSTGSTGALAQNEELAVAFCFSNATTANTPDAGWAETQDIQVSTNRRFISEYQITAASTALNAGGTVGNAAWGAIIATYKGASSPATVAAGTGSATADGDTVGVAAAILRVGDSAAATASGHRVFLPFRSGGVVNDGVWTWYNDPRAITRNGATYIGVLNSNGDAVVAKLVHATAVVTTFTLHSALDVDDHANPALTFLPGGRLLALYVEHNGGAVRGRISTASESITAWGTEFTLPNVSGVLAVSYANPWVLSDEGDRLYVMFRGKSWMPTIVYSDDWDTGTPTWSTPRDLFHGRTGGISAPRPYGKYVSDGAGKLHFFYSADHPTIVAGRCHMYHFYYDAADGNFHTSDGTTIRSLASLATTGELAESEVTKVYDATTNSGGGNGNAWPWSIELDADGKPVVAYSVFEDFDDNHYHYARWTGSAWERHTILTDQGSLYGAGDTAEDEYVGGLVIDPEDTTHLYVSNDTSGQYEIEQWSTADGGTTWATSPVTSGSSFHNARPTCPRDREAGGPEVLWWSGTYTSYTTYVTSVRASPAPSSAMSAEPTGIPSAEGVGSPTMAGPAGRNVAPSPIASGEAFGTPAFLVDATVDPGAITSGETFGSPSVFVDQEVSPAAIGSGEGFGAVLVLSPRKVVPVGIPSLDQPGTPTIGVPSVGKSLKVRLSPGHRGIPSREAFGTPKLTPGLVKPSPIGSQGAVGSPSIVIPQFVLPAAIASAEIVPGPSLARPDTIVVGPTASSEAFGQLVIVRAGVIEPTAIASAEAFGTPELGTLEQTVVPGAIGSGETVGTPTIVQFATHVIAPAGITTGLAFGIPTVVGAPNAPVLPGSIISGERFGLPRITVGIPEGPVNQPPGRIANRLYDPETGVAFAFAINHAEEDPRGFERTYEAGAPTTVGLARHQAVPDLMHLVFRGTILDPAQKTSLDTLFDYSDQNTLIYEDYSGEAYEVIITTWDCRPERARNPYTRGLVMWRYTMDLAILRVLHGAIDDAIGQPAPVPPDIVVQAPATPIQPAGIQSREAFGAVVAAGGNTVLVPTAIRSISGLGLVIVTGGSAPGGGGAGGGGGGSIPAAFPSRLETRGTRIVDSNGFILNRMTGVNVHCLPGYIPSQQDLHEIKARGGSWVRVVLTWANLEDQQGVLSTTMKAQIDTLLARLQVAGLYAELELHLNVGAVPGWTTGADETAKYAAHGQFITQALAQRYGTNKVVFGFGLNEIPAYQATLDYGNGVIPYLESVQRQMISWMRVSAPDWIGVVTLGYSNQTPYPDAPRTAASPTAYNAVGGNVVLDVHPYQAGVNSNDPSYDGRQPNGMIYPTYQGGLAYWQVSQYPLAYVDTAIHRAQMIAFLADYVTFCTAAQIPLMAGETGWAANNTGGKAAWWAAQFAAYAWANPAMAAQWIFSYNVPPQEYWPAKPGGVWDPQVEKLLSGVW